MLVVVAINTLFLPFCFGALFCGKYRTEPNDLSQSQRSIRSRSARFSRAGFSSPHWIWRVSCTTASFRGVGTFASFPFLTTNPESAHLAKVVSPNWQVELLVGHDDPQPLRLYRFDVCGPLVNQNYIVSGCGEVSPHAASYGTRPQDGNCPIHINSAFLG